MQNTICFFSEFLKHSTLLEDNNYEAKAKSWRWSIGYFEENSGDFQSLHP